MAVNWQRARSPEQKADHLRTKTVEKSENRTAMQSPENGPAKLPGMMQKRMTKGNGRSMIQILKGIKEFG